MICGKFVAGMTDQSSNLNVFISNKTIGASISEGKYIWTFGSTSSLNGSAYKFSSAEIIKVLQLSKVASSMTICEVQMYEAGMCLFTTYNYMNWIFLLNYLYVKQIMFTCFLCPSL